MDNANAVVEVPAWAWAVMGGTLVLVGGKAIGFILDVILIQWKGATPKAPDSRGIQIDTCTQTCRVQWEGAIATSLARSQVEIGAKIDNGFQRVHERIDEILGGKGKP